MEFIPFKEVSVQNPTVVVDARHPAACVTLSHWRGAQVPDALRADTSTEIVLKSLAFRPDYQEMPFVSNNHFDVDGFLGIWSMLNPALALRHKETLIQAATIADFREYSPEQPTADLALKLVCWINAEEKQAFYEPFGEKQESEACVPKYRYFLPRLTRFLSNPDSFSSCWEEEYVRVKQDLNVLDLQGEVSEIEDIHVRIVECPEPLHYYAMFSQSARADLLLMMFSDHRYELEYKYSSWVDTHTRTHFPRLNFDPLAQILNSQETREHQWWGNSIMDTGPSLRLGSGSLSKAKRFANPFERDIHPSSISPQQMKQTVIRFYRERLKNISPRRRWTWQEMRDINLRL